MSTLSEFMKELRDKTIVKSEDSFALSLYEIGLAIEEDTGEQIVNTDFEGFQHSDIDVYGYTYLLARYPNKAFDKDDYCTVARVIIQDENKQAIGTITLINEELHNFITWMRQDAKQERFQSQQG